MRSDCEEEGRDDEVEEPELDMYLRLMFLGVVGMSEGVFDQTAPLVSL